MPIDRKLLRQLASFVGVGAIATGLQYAILFLGVEWLQFNAVVASCVGYALSAVVNYLLNYHVTFVSTNSHAVAASRFALVAAAGLALNAALMTLLVAEIEMPYLWGQLVTTAIVLVWNFAGNAWWSFAAARTSSGEMTTGGRKLN